MIDRETAKRLFRKFRSIRTGIRNDPDMAGVCLICGSTDVVPLAGHEPQTMHCRNCGFNFIRYICRSCGETVDGRDPENPACRQCGWRICVCSACQPDECSAQARRVALGTEP